MHCHRLPDDQAILHQLADLLACLGIGNLISLVGIQPNLLLATAHDAGRQALLKPEHTWETSWIRHVIRRNHLTDKLFYYTQFGFVPNFLWRFSTPT
uniref:Uncharacterized protein n=1 Tax=Hippocampus comes TaxID=109280 RepID=A0A3Q2ZHB8_HIPCM